MDKRFFLVIQNLPNILMKHFLKPFGFTILLIFAFSQISAQDIHFSQIDAADLVTVNPAHTGDYDGDWKFGGLYRSQWPDIEKAFSSATVFYDQQIADKLSAGIVLINDQAGLIRLNSNKVYLSGAYHTSLGKEKAGNNTFRFGLQLGGVYKSLDPAALSFPDQFDRDIGAFNGDLTTDERVLNNSLFYMDINAGINFRFNQTGKISPSIGFAVLHINNPSDSFLGDKEKLPQRYIADISLNWQLGEQFYLRPFAMTTVHATANETLFGADLLFSFYENPTTITGAFLGLSTRIDGVDVYNDAVIAKAGLNFGNIRLGFSYDYNVSDLQIATDGFGAVELSLIYMAQSTRLREIQVPCDRF